MNPKSSRKDIDRYALCDITLPPVPLSVAIAVVAIPVPASAAFTSISRPGPASASPPVVVSAATPATAAAGAHPRWLVFHQILQHFPRNLLHVHKVAVATTVAVTLIILSAACLIEFRHWAIFSSELSTAVPTPLHCFHCLLCIFFGRVFDVNIADQVISEVVADVEFLDLAKLCYLVEDIDVEILEVLLQLPLLIPVEPASRGHELRHRVLVHVQQRHTLTEQGLIVQATAPVSVTACSNLVVERAVHSAAMTRAQTNARGLVSEVATILKAYTPAWKTQCNTSPRLTLLTCPPPYHKSLPSGRPFFPSTNQAGRATSWCFYNWFVGRRMLIDSS